MRRALEATEFTDLGIIQCFLTVSAPPVRELYWAELSVNKCLLDQQLLDSLHVNRINDCKVIEIAFLFFGLLGENVAVVSVSSLDFTRSGERKTLLGTGIGLHFRHFDLF